MLGGGCAAVDTTPEKRPDMAALTVPSPMLKADAKPIRWYYWNFSRQDKRIRVSLSGITIFRSRVGRTPSEPLCFGETQLAPGKYTITVEDLDLGKTSATEEFKSELTDEILLNFDRRDPPRVIINTNGGFCFI